MKIKMTKKMPTKEGIYFRSYCRLDTADVVEVVVDEENDRLVVYDYPRIGTPDSLLEYQDYYWSPPLEISLTSTE